jgi:hypothetical protein
MTSPSSRMFGPVTIKQASLQHTAYSALTKSSTFRHLRLSGTAFLTLPYAPRHTRQRDGKRMDMFSMHRNTSYLRLTHLGHSHGRSTSPVSTCSGSLYYTPHTTPPLLYLSSSQHTSPKPPICTPHPLSLSSDPTHPPSRSISLLTSPLYLRLHEHAKTCVHTTQHR